MMWSLMYETHNWKFKVMINGCDNTCFDNILDKMKEFQEPEKIIICKLLLMNPACAIRRSSKKALFSGFKVKNMALLNNQQ